MNIKIKKNLNKDKNVHTYLDEKEEIRNQRNRTCSIKGTFRNPSGVQEHCGIYVLLYYL